MINFLQAMDSIESGDEDYHIFKQEDLFSDALPIMKEIRRQGKLCDVKLNVGVVELFICYYWISKIKCAFMGGLEAKGHPRVSQKCAKTVKIE